MVSLVRIRVPPLEKVLQIQRALLEIGLVRTTTFSRAYGREFERLREEAEARGVGLWDA
jgi:hypothetical protein